MPPWKRALLWVVPVFAVLAVAGFFVAKAAIDRYLRSENFRAFLAQKAGDTLQGEAQVSPLHFDTASLYTDRFSAQGNPGAAFSGLELHGLRAELSWRRFFEQVWQVDRVEIQRVQVQLDGPRVEAPPATVPVAPSAGAESRSRWIPDRVEIAAATIHEAELSWKEGGLRGTALQFQPGDGGWKVEGSGGKITHAGLPPLEVERLSLRYREPSIFINHAEFRQGANGSVSATGEIKTNERLDLHASIKNIELTPYLSGDWRARLKGNASGEIDIRSPLPLRGSPTISGTMSLAGGQLEALPVLDQIALFTRTQQFRRLALSRATGEFIQSGTRLTVSDLILESEGLIRVEGGFTIEGETIDGSFQVGVVPASLQWLPGSQARVFTTARGAYVWAPMRLTGPLGSPKEDLTARLTEAAAGAVLEQVGSTVKDVTKGVQEAARGALDLLLSPPK
ncbi:MAG TPA: hypothetical protein VF593_09055 [Chthoniobacteraceae bacterium]